MSSDEENFYVEKILNKKGENNKTFYLIKWKDWPTSQSTWEPLENLENVLNMVNEFEENLLRSKNEKLKKKKLSLHSNNSNLNKKRELVLKSGEDNSMLKSSKVVNINIIDTPPKKHYSNINQEAGKKINSRLNNYNKELEVDLHTDIPDKIMGNKLEQDEFFLLIDWKERNDGSKPKPSYVANTYLKFNHPKILIDFYISNIKFTGK